MSARYFLCLLCTLERHCTTLGSDDLFQYSDKNDKGNGFFEGDLKLPVQMIMGYYDLESIPEGKNKFYKKYLEIGGKRIAHGAAASYATALWKNKTVWYKYSPDLSSFQRNQIKEGIKHWENRTCLRFLPAENHPDFIYFTAAHSSCYSDYIGKKGGKQVVNIGISCTALRYVVHEIAHALGFWHENTRPDRDRYIRVNIDKVFPGHDLNFMIRKYLEIDYQGSGYDYNSVMHYPEYAFSYCYRPDCKTITVANISEYNRQGRPQLGGARSLSIEDTKQANRLYSCPGKGVRGFLSIKVKRGHFTSRNSAKLYVLLTALDASGMKYIQKTQFMTDNESEWNEFVLYGEQEWQFFRISTWSHHKLRGDSLLTMSQTVLVKSGRHTGLKHCKNITCAEFVLFDYVLFGRISEKAMLIVFVGYARNLMDTDNGRNKPDPYVRVEATDSNIIKTPKTTRTVLSTTKPVWNQRLIFGCKKWASIFIQVFDADFGIDDKLSEKKLVFLQPGEHNHLVHQAYGNGIMSYGYTLTQDRCCT